MNRFFYRLSKLWVCWPWFIHQWELAQEWELAQAYEDQKFPIKFTPYGIEHCVFCGVWRWTSVRRIKKYHKQWLDALGRD